MVWVPPSMQVCGICFTCSIIKQNNDAYDTGYTPKLNQCQAFGHITNRKDSMSNSTREVES